MTGTATRLALDPCGPNRWRGRMGDANQNGVAYGGLLLGQAMRAVTLAGPVDHPVTMLSCLFLRGARPEHPLDIEVVPLQQGRRFQSCEAVAQQGGRAAFRALATCGRALPGPRQAMPCTAPDGDSPEAAVDLGEVPAARLAWRERIGGYGMADLPGLDFRVPDPDRQLMGVAGPGAFRYWVKTSDALPAADAGLHLSAFAYLTDWWLNFCLLRPHLSSLAGRRLQISSLNHVIWIHALPRADAWIHVDTTALGCGEGRGLALAQYHDAQGRHLATATQECLLAYAQAP